MAVSSISPDSQVLLAQRLKDAQTQQDTAARAAQRKADLDSALQAAGADPTKLADLEQQIAEAVQKAREQSGSSTDPRTAIRDAINGVLTQNGLDPAKFDAQMKTLRATGHRHRHGGGLIQPASATTTPAAQPAATTPTSTTVNGTSLNITA